MSGNVDAVVPVSLGERSYDIKIGNGLIRHLARDLQDFAPGARAAIVTDETVAGHWLTETEGALAGR